jgi:hypothetical protein
MSETVDQPLLFESAAVPERLPAVQEPAPPPEPPTLMNFIAAALTNPAIDVSKLDALLRMQREVAADDARAQFNRALHEAQAEMPRVKKNGSINLVKDGVSKGELRFATWEDVDSVVRPIMTKHGFSVTFSSPQKTETGIVWTATHRHLSGHQETNSITLAPDTGAGRNALQAAGSTNSYAKRYLVEDFYNIVREGADDDGKRGGTVYATEEQVDEIRELLRATKADIAKFRANFEIRDETELTREAFIKAKNMLLQKRAQMERGK